MENLSINAQIFLENFKQYIKNTGNTQRSILTTVNNDATKAVKELIKAGLLAEVEYSRGFQTISLKQ